MTALMNGEPPEFVIRPPRPEDVWPADLGSPEGDQDHSSWRRSLVAADGGQVVGSGTIALAPANDVYLVEVQVSAAQRRRGVGTALVEALRSSADQPFALCGRVMSSQPWRRAFTDSLGCTVRVRCPAPWIDPTSEAGEFWADQQRIPVGYALRTLARIDPTLVADAWCTYSAWAHRAFGNVRLDRVRDQWEPYAERLDPYVSMVAVDDAGSVVALSLVTPDGWQGRTFVVAETVEEDQPDGDAVLAATVAASVRALRARGVRLVELEGHATDPHLPALARSLPPGGADPMEIVELVGPASGRGPVVPG